MAFMRKKTPEELAADEEERARAEERYQTVVARAKALREATDDESRRTAFAHSPAGQARAAFGREDRLLQCTIEFALGGPMVIAVVGHSVTQQLGTPAEVLNSIDQEGWELVTGSFQPGMGTTFGHYLFRRRPPLGT